MDEFLCLTLQGGPGESENAFKQRLVAFWTHMIRTHPDDYEKVYAESRTFEPVADRWTRQYMIEIGVKDLLERELAAQLMEHEPLDEDDTYNKAEASSSEWFQIPHD